MNLNIKEIVSQFIRIPPEQIDVSTIIDRNAIGSSIMLHRMFAKLADCGFVVNDYHSIIKFGDLIQQLNDDKSTFSTSIHSVGDAHRYDGATSDNMAVVGIDIEDIKSFPTTMDFRVDPFYTQNFSSAEISFCILKKNPYSSFAGLFAIKEAIVKVDNSLSDSPFNLIEIQHELNGRPYFPKFSISISHTELLAVAVAIKCIKTEQKPDFQSDASIDTREFNQLKGINSALWLSALALLVSIIVLTLVLLR